MVCYDSEGNGYEVDGLKNNFKYKVMFSDHFVKLDRNNKGLVFALYLNTPKDGENVIKDDDLLVLM